MSFKKIIAREIEVAFAKHVQPIWLRILKYLILAAIIYSLWATKWLWIVVGGMFAAGILLHLWYRYKTNGWTKSYGKWDYEKNKPV